MGRHTKHSPSLLAHHPVCSPAHPKVAMEDLHHLLSLWLWTPHPLQHSLSHSSHQQLVTGEDNVGHIALCSLTPPSLLPQPFPFPPPSTPTHNGVLSCTPFELPSRSVRTFTTICMYAQGTPPHHTTTHTPHYTTPHYTTPHYTTPHHTTLHHTTPHYTTLHYTTPHTHTTPHHTTPHYTTPHHTTHHTTPHHTTPHYTTPHYTTPHHTSHHTTLHHTTLHHTTPHITPHHTTPHRTTQYLTMSNVLRFLFWSLFFIKVTRWSF